MRKRLSLVVAAGVAVLSLTGCSNLFSALFGTHNPAGTALSVQVVTEYKDSLTSSAGRGLSRGVATTLTAAQVDNLVAAAQAAVDAAGLHNSTAVDKIVAAMVQGVAAQVQTAAASATPIDLSSALVVAAQSAVTSIAKTGRENNVSSGLSTETAIAQATAAMVKITDSAIVDPQVRLATKAAMVQEAVTALDSADTVSTAAEVSSAVQNIVQQVAATQTSDSSSFQTVLAAATSSAATLTKVDAAAKTTMATAVATAAVNAIADAKAAGSVVANEDSLVTAVAAEVGDIDSTAAVSVAAAISTAIANASLSISTAVSSNIATVVAETAPSVSATAQIAGGTAANSVTVSNVGTTVTLVASPSTLYAGGVSIVGWTRLSAGPQVDAATDTSGNTVYTVTPATAGTFVYQVTVKNTGGEKTATATVTIVSTISISSAVDYVNQGIQYLGSQNIEAAKAAFVNALAADGTNRDALFWKTFIDLMGVAVNPDFVSVMQNRFGFAGYPSSLSVLMSNTWMNQTWYETKAGFGVMSDPSTAVYGYVRGTFTPDPTSAFYVYYYSSNDLSSSQDGPGTFAPSNTGPSFVAVTRTDTSAQFMYSYNGAPIDASLTLYEEDYSLVDLSKPYLLPAITAPTWAPKLAEQNTIASYALVALANVIDRNPSGFNAVLDSLVGATGPFGTGFDEIITNVKALALTDSITIPANLITALTGQTPTFAVQVTGAELLAFAAQLELDKGLLQYIDSYDFGYPLSALHFDFGDQTAMSVDMNNNGIPDTEEAFMAAAPGPFKQVPGQATLLADRSQTIRDASRTNIMNAANDLYAAASSLQTNLANGAFDSYIPASAYSGTTYLSADDYSKNYLAPMIGNYLSTIQNFHDSVADTSGATAFVAPAGSATTNVYLGNIFSSAVFSLPNLFVYDSTNTYPIAYLGYWLDNSGSWVEIGSYVDARTVSDWTPFNSLALKLNASKLGHIWPDYINALPVASENGMYSPLIYGANTNFDSVSEIMEKWILGQP